MLFGDVFPTLTVPPLPAGSDITEEQYYATAKTLWKQKLISTGITPARGSWMGMSDVPEQDDDFPAFLHTKLAETSIDTANVNVPAAGSDNSYCITTDAELVCYTQLFPQWTGGGDDPFEFEIQCGNGITTRARTGFTVQNKRKFE